MVAYASQADRFAPIDLPRVAVSGDGSLAAIHEVSRVTLLELPGGAPFAEIGADPDALASQVAWVGTPPRLLVLSRYDGHSTAHLIDPLGPSTIAEIRLEATMGLVSTVAGWALVVGSLGAAVLTAGESYLGAYQFPARAVPVAAGPAANLFLVALASSVEEWDPQSRMPRRRMRLPRTAAITAVGGSERLVWVTTQQEPARIDVIPLVNRGQPKGHDLPEPILHITGHPRSDLVACIGAESGRLYIVDLDGRTRLRVIDPEGFDRVDAASMVIGRMTGVVAARARHPIAIVRLDGRDPEVEPAASSDSPGALLTRPIRPLVIDERDVVAQGRSQPIAIRAALRDEPIEPAPPTMFALRPSLDDELSPLPDEELSSPPDEDPSLSHEPSLPSMSDEPSPSDEPSASEGLSAPGEPSSNEAPSAAEEPLSNEAPSAAEEPSPSDEPSIAREPSASASRPSISIPQVSRPSGGGTSSVLRSASAPSAPKSSPASTASRFSAWRDMVRHNQAPIEQSSPRAVEHSVPPRLVATAPRDDAPRSWRDELVSWHRAAGASPDDDVVLGAPDAPAIDVLVARFELAPRLRPVLARLYAAHLCGEAGIAPVDVARLLDRQWDEALGRGELARTGFCEYVRSRVALSPVVLRVLDELSPLGGALIGTPGPVALLGPCVVVAGGEPLSAVAERCLSRVGGAILVGRSDVPRVALAFEARAHGAVAMLRIDRTDRTARPGSSDGPEPMISHDPVIFVVDDGDLADRLGVPYLP